MGPTPAFVVGKDENLTTAHARFRSQIIRLTREAGVLSMANDIAPQFSGLPEADRSDMLFFVEQLRKVLPIVGFNLFEVAQTSSAVNSGEHAFNTVRT